MYCGLSTASDVFHIFTTQLNQYISVFFLSALFSQKPEEFLRKYSQTAILHAAHFPRVVNVSIGQGNHNEASHIQGETGGPHTSVIQSGSVLYVTRISAFAYKYKMQ